jgi:transcriptional regulator with XRE-family HTH domain
MHVLHLLARMPSVTIYGMHAGTQARGVATVPMGTATVPDVIKASPASTAGEYFESLLKASEFANRAELGEASGVDPGTIGRWIRGEKLPTLDKLLAVAPHLKVRAGDLVVAFGLATMEDLGMVGAPPVATRPVEREIHARLSDPTKTARHKRALENHLEYSLELFDEVVAQVENSPREPRMRRR